MNRKLYIILLLFISTNLFARQAPDSQCVINFLVYEDIIYCPIYNVDVNSIHYDDIVYYTKDNCISWSILDFDKTSLPENIINKLKYDYLLYYTNPDTISQINIFNKNGEMYRINHGEIDYSYDNGQTWQEDWKLSNSKNEFYKNYYDVSWKYYFIGPFDLIFSPDESGTVIATLGSEGLLIKNQNSNWKHISLSDIIEPSPEYITNPFIIFEAFNFQYFLFFIFLSTFYLIFNFLFFKLISIKNNIIVKIRVKIIFIFAVLILLYFISFILIAFIGYIPISYFTPTFLLSYIIILIIDSILKSSFRKVDKFGNNAYFLKNRLKIKYITFIFLLLPLIPAYLWGIRILPFINTVEIIIIAISIIYLINIIFFIGKKSQHVV